MSTVAQRCVFYLSGFDPKGASHYHALYRAQAQQQGAVNGWSFEVGPRQRLTGSADAPGAAYWSVQARANAPAPRDEHAASSAPVELALPGHRVRPLEGERRRRDGGGPRSPGHRVRPLEGEAPQALRGWSTFTHYEFLPWDDIVRRHWPKPLWALWLQVLQTTAFNLRHAALWRMFLLSWPPALALFAPFVLVCVQLLGLPLGLLLGWLGAATAGSGAVGLLLGLALAGLLLWQGRRLDARYSMYWMVRSYAFTARQARGQVPDLERRIDAHAQRLLARWRAALDDEILLVGHSTGSVMAVSVLARALALEPALGRSGPPIALLTLGQWLPLLGLLPQAQRFRAELASLAQPGRAQLHWIDFSAPPDGCCFALTDPLAACGVVCTDAAPDRPKLLSPKFAEMFAPPDYQRLRGDKFRMHFQYLMAGQRASAYDYFLITAADQPLHQRFAGHPSVRDFVGLKPFRAPSA